MSSYQYRKSHCGDKTILRPSYLHNGISYTGKMTSLYWIRTLVLCHPSVLPVFPNQDPHWRISKPRSNSRLFVRNPQTRPEYALKLQCTRRNKQNIRALFYLLWVDSDRFTHILQLLHLQTTWANSINEKTLRKKMFQNIERTQCMFWILQLSVM